jgi:hypothetical protein
MGYVSLAGLFEAGTVVSLWEVDGEGTLRVGAAALLVGRRLVDSSGSVGFDGLADGGRFFASGYGAEGGLLELRCRSLADGEASELAQPPVAEVPVLVGTQEAKVVEPAPGEPSAILHVGVPDAAVAA